jgi:hypothetical protein
MRKTGKGSPLAAIEALASELVDVAGLNGPPVDLELIASFRNIIQIVFHDMPSAGRLVPQPDGFLRIEVNSRHSTGKQRFTIAHEVVHTVLPTYQRQFHEDRDTGTFWWYGATEDQDEDEAICDAGAAALLMDERWVRRFLGHQEPTSIGSLLAAADEFEVSLHSMAWRLARMVSEPLAFVIWQLGYRKSEISHTITLPGFDPPQPKLRVQTVYPSATFPQKWFIPKNKSVAEESLVYQAMEHPLKLTHGAFDFDLGSSTGIVRMWTENLSAPIMGEPRVISLVKPTP